MSELGGCQCGTKRTESRLQLIESLGPDCIVDPASLAAVTNETSLLESPQMEGEPGLLSTEGLAQVADAAFALAQELQHPQSGLIGQGVEKLGAPC